MDLIKYDMTDLWAVSGDVVSPGSTKIRQGWGVEVVPRQWWNWFENRQDNNIAYMLQKGIPEWDATTQYIINKSFVQRSGVVYKATATSTGTDPVTLVSWVRAFGDYSTASNALGSLTPAVDQLPYFNGTTTAALTNLTAFARTLLDDVDATTARTTIGAQASNVNLTSLAGVTAATNGLPYFTGTTAMGITTLTAFGRSLIAVADAATARTTLSAQTLNSNLTALSGITGAADLLPYFTAAGTMTTTTMGTFARSVLAASTAAAARTTLVAAMSGANTDITSLTGVTLGGTTVLGNHTEALVTVASAATTDIGTAASNVVTITGTATITSLGVAPAGTRKQIRFAGVMTLAHSASVLSLPTQGNIITAVDDVAEVRSLGAGNWFCTEYNRANGQPLAVVSVVQGGTGAATAATARTNLGLGSVDNTSDVNKPVSTAQQTALDGKQTLDATLTTLAALTNGADTLPYFTGIDVASTTPLTAFSRTAIACADAAAWKTTLGFVSQTSQTGAAGIPAGTTALRPASPTSGMFRYNSDTNQFEGYQNGSWGGIAGGGVGPTFLDGLQMVYKGTRAITITAGSCSIPNGGSCSTLTDIALTGIVTVSGFNHFYAYDSGAGSMAIEVSSTVPVLVSGTMYQKTGDATRRYIGSALASTSLNFYSFRHDSLVGDIIYTNGTPGVAPFPQYGTASMSLTTVAVDTTVAPIQTATQLYCTALISNGNIVFGIPEQTTALGNSNWLVSLLAAAGISVSVAIPLSRVPATYGRMQLKGVAAGAALSLYATGYRFER
jgi:hypothetical protein